MFSKILFTILFALSAFGYDELLIDAQSSVVPKIALLDKDIQKKLVGGKLQIVIACDAEDIGQAKEIVAKMNANNAGRVGSYALTAVAVEFSQLSKNEASLIYMLRSSDANIKKAVNAAKHKGVVSFVYDRADLTNGAMLSMNIERSAVITLKRSAMRDSGVQFVDSFYKIVRIIE